MTQQTARALIKEWQSYANGANKASFLAQYKTPQDYVRHIARIRGQDENNFE
jgi:hypothetical protein